MYTKKVTLYDVDFHVDFDYEPYTPAQTSGPPEKCYPAEGGEVTINSILIDEWEVQHILAQHVLDSIKQDIEISIPDLQQSEKEEAEMEAYEAKQFEKRYG
jgi:hypothetical protein